MLKSVLRELTTQSITGENVGITLFETNKAKTVLMAIDYSLFDNIEKSKRTAVVSVNMDNVIDVKSDRDVIKVRDNSGKLCELRFDILPHETVFIELIK